MQRDLKIGLSLGVLLVGVVGAFFNRREVLTDKPDESLQVAQQDLDERIAERPRKPYLTGIESDDFPQPNTNPKRPPLRQSPPQFSLEEFAADHEAPAPTEGSKQRAAVNRPMDDGAPAERESTTAERPRTQTSASNSAKERVPSVHSISITSTGPNSRQKDPELPSETSSTVPSPDALEGDRPLAETTAPATETAEPASAEPAKEGSLFTRPTRSPFVRNSKQANKQNSKSGTGKPAQSKGKGDPASTSRPSSKGNQAKADAGEEIRTADTASENSAPTLYKVKPGDSLDKIALQYYRNTSKAHAIFEANKDKLKSPDSIREGMQIKLP